MAAEMRRYSTVLRHFALIALWLTLAGATSQGTAIAGLNGVYTGVATCAGSTCHGRAEGNGEIVRQDEIATWQEPSSPSGAHSRAFSVLRSERSRRIAAKIGLTDPATAAACLGCHSIDVPASRRGARFLASDGVGCEACHGPASGWIASHYAKPASHAANLAAGMTKLEDPQVRAGICLDCHYGSKRKGQFVTHSMMAAGHPRLSFELELFSTLQQHHDADADYTARKHAPGSVQLWAVGQAEAVARETDLFADQSLRMTGLFPQFYFYDCHSCHRQISDDPARKGTFEPNPDRPIPFGNPPFNDEHMIMLSMVAQVLAPAEGQAFDRASLDFHRSMGEHAGSLAAATERLHGRAERLSAAFAQLDFPEDAAFRVVAAIAERTAGPRFTDYAGSAQAVMAVDGMLNSLVRDGRITLGAAAGIRAEINRAYDAVKSPTAFSPAQFRSSLQNAARSIGALR